MTDYEIVMRLTGCQLRARLDLAKWLNSGVGTVSKDDGVLIVKPVLDWHPVFDVRTWVGNEFEKWSRRGYLECVNRGKLVDGKRPLKLYALRKRIEMRWKGPVPKV